MCSPKPKDVRYLMIREEVMYHMQQRDNVLTYTIPVVITLLTFSVTIQNYVIPLLVGIFVLFSLIKQLRHEDAVYKLTSYLQTSLEGPCCTYNWETIHQKFERVKTSNYRRMGYFYNILWPVLAALPVLVSYGIIVWKSIDTKTYGLFGEGYEIIRVYVNETSLSPSAQYSFFEIFINPHYNIPLIIGIILASIICGIYCWHFFHKESIRMNYNTLWKNVIINNSKNEIPSDACFFDHLIYTVLVVIIFVALLVDIMMMWTGDIFCIMGMVIPLLFPFLISSPLLSPILTLILLYN